MVGTSGPLLLAPVKKAHRSPKTMSWGQCWEGLSLGSHCRQGQYSFCLWLEAMRQTRYPHRSIIKSYYTGGIWTLILNIRSKGNNFPYIVNGFFSKSDIFFSRNNAETVWILSFALVVCLVTQSLHWCLRRGLIKGLCLHTLLVPAEEFASQLPQRSTCSCDRRVLQCAICLNDVSLSLSVLSRV